MKAVMLVVCFMPVCAQAESRPLPVAVVIDYASVEAFAERDDRIAVAGRALCKRAVGWHTLEVYVRPLPSREWYRCWYVARYVESVPHVWPLFAYTYNHDKRVPYAESYAIRVKVTNVLGSSEAIVKNVRRR